jgi:hypothetical protein
MEMVSIGLWIAGAILVIVAVFQARGPFSRLSELDRLADNARRYDSWRGSRRAGDDQPTTGADIMRQLLRRRVLLWAAVAGAGVLIILAGFAVRP